MPAAVISERDNAVRIDIRVAPRASKNAIAGVRDGRLVVRVTAPPVESAANDAVIALLAEQLHVSKRQITIVLGATSRSKTIEIVGAPADAIQSRLSDILT